MAYVLLILLNSSQIIFGEHLGAACHSAVRKTVLRLWEESRQCSFHFLAGEARGKEASFSFLFLMMTPS